MNFRSAWRAILLSTCTSTIQQVTAHADQFNCSQIITEHRLPQKPFVPFAISEIKHPQTGQPLSLTQEITLESEPGKDPIAMPAGDFLQKINEMEANLSPWGYSLRDTGEVTLGELATCVQLLQSQARSVEERLRKDLPVAAQLDQWTPRFQEAWNRYKSDLPSWDELQRRANDEAYNTYLPPVPPLAVVPPIKSRTELKPLFKERPWPFNWGEGKDLNVWGEANLKVRASKVEAVATASLTAEGKMLGKNIGQIVSIMAHAESPGTDKLKANFLIFGLGRQVFAWNHEGGGLNQKDNLAFPLEYVMDYRFSIGPIPMRARAGFQGKIGLAYGYNLTPLRVGAHAMPYARSNVFAQVGADIMIGGAGVGGELTLVNLDIPLTADVFVEWDDEPTVKIDIVGSSELTALAGELYAYAYVYHPKPWPPWKDKWQGKWAFFNWSGIVRKGNIFNYHGVLTSAGLVASGDLTASDVAEVQAVNAQARVAELEAKSNQHVVAVVKAVAAELSATSTLSVLSEKQKVQQLDVYVGEGLSNYKNELAQWLQNEPL
jgi:hypothetical protein